MAFPIEFFSLYYFQLIREKKIVPLEALPENIKWELFDEAKRIDSSCGEVKFKKICRAIHVFSYLSYTLNQQA